MVGAPGTDFVGPVPEASNMPCPNSIGSADGVEGAGRGARDDHVHHRAEGAAILRKVHEMPAKS